MSPKRFSLEFHNRTRPSKRTLNITHSIFNSEHSAVELINVYLNKLEQGKTIRRTNRQTDQKTEFVNIF